MTTRRFGRRQPQAYFVYWIAVMASAVAAFGEMGWLVGGAVLMLWGFAMVLRFWESALITVLALLLVALLLPVIPTERRTRRLTCHNNLSSISLALDNYHDAHGSFPPAHIADEEGRPMHSWRVLLLPYVDEQALFEEYDFNEPWDGPHNRLLYERIPSIYFCPSESGTERVKRGLTSFVAVTGKRTPWPGTEGSKLKDFTDDMSGTVLLMEENGEEIRWTEPRDLTEEESLRSMNDDSLDSWHGHRFKKDFFGRDAGRFVTFANGAVRYLLHRGDGEVWRSLIRINDGGPAGGWLDWEQSTAKAIQKSEPRWPKWIAFSVFAILALFPLPWVWWKPNSSTHGMPRETA